MRRGLVVFLSLYTCSSLAETRSAEVCRTDAPFVRAVNHGRGELLIDATDADGERRAELIELLRDHQTVVNVADHAPVDSLVRAILEDGAIVTAGHTGTAPDCVNVVAGHEAWAHLTSSEVAGR